MNYYEELGIRSDADEEEIRKAHRRLVKIMHPDQHRDQGLKQLAETQMRRLNSIVATLLDPEERRDYDEQLRGGSDAAAATQQSSWRSVPWWIASTLGAIVLTVAAVWFFADHIGSSFNTHSSNPPQLEKLPGTEKDNVTTVQVPAPKTPVKPPAAATDQNHQVADSQANGAVQNPPETVTSVPVQEKPKTEPAPEKAKALPVNPLPPPASTYRKKLMEVPVRELRPASHSIPSASVPTQKAPVAPVPKKVLKEVPAVTAAVPHNQLDASLRPPPSPLGGSSAPSLDIPSAPGFVPPPATPAITRNLNRDPLEGEWVYAPTEPEKRKPGFYIPEFIQLRLRKDSSGMRGEYSARYNIADNRPVSPDVNFVLKATDPKALHYVWTAADGSKGWFVIRSLEPDTLRLEWKTTSSHSGPALSSGMATLVRKN